MFLILRLAVWLVAFYGISTLVGGGARGVMVIVLGNGIEFSLQLWVKCRALKLKIDLVSYPARAEGFGKYDINPCWLFYAISC